MAAKTTVASQRASVPAPISPPQAPERLPPSVGPHVRRWRRERGLTLAQVAERSGLNVGYLSQIENDKASPSLACLSALSAAIDVPMTWFLLDASKPPSVVRAGARRRWRGPGGVSVEEVDGAIPRDVRVALVTNGPGQRTGLHAHAGDEHHFLLSGRIRLTQGPHTIDLGPGDYLLWDATIPHDAECIGDEPAVLLLIGHHFEGTEASQPEG